MQAALEGIRPAMIDWPRILAPGIAAPVLRA